MVTDLYNTFKFHLLSYNPQRTTPKETQYHHHTLTMNTIVMKHPPRPPWPSMPQTEHWHRLPSLWPSDKYTPPTQFGLWPLLPKPRATRKNCTPLAQWCHHTPCQTPPLPGAPQHDCHHTCIQLHHPSQPPHSYQPHSHKKAMPMPHATHTKTFPHLSMPRLQTQMHLQLKWPLPLFSARIFIPLPSMIHCLLPYHWFPYLRFMGISLQRFLPVSSVGISFSATQAHCLLPQPPVSLPKTHRNFPAEVSPGVSEGGDFYWMAVHPKVPYRTLTIRLSLKLLHAVPIRTLTHTHTILYTLLYHGMQHHLCSMQFCVHSSNATNKLWVGTSPKTYRYSWSNLPPEMYVAG